MVAGHAKASSRLTGPEPSLTRVCRGPTCPGGAVARLLGCETGRWIRPDASKDVATMIHKNWQELIKPNKLEVIRFG